MDVIKYKYTNTTKFILPLLFKDNDKYYELFQNFFINSYIADIRNKENDDKIHLVFADYPSLNLQKKLANPITEYQYGEGYVLVYPLENKWIDDYTKIITGCYSKISEEAKQRIISFWNEEDDSVLYGVLYKRGDAIQKYLQKVLHLKYTEPFANDKEWWLKYKISEEILGLSN